MITIFTAIERGSALLECGGVELLKTIIYFNLQVVAPPLILDQLGDGQNATTDADLGTRVLPIRLWHEGCKRIKLLSLVGFCYCF